MKNTLEDYRRLAKQSLTDAVSLPFEVYRDEEIYQKEVANIFHGDWVFACAEKEVIEVGAYYAFDLAGEAVAIVRGQDGVLRALSNICRHRGTILLDEGYGVIDRNIVCPYHAWTYSDQGSLKAAPFANGIDLDKPSHCLPGFALETWMGLVFVCINEPTYSIAERFEGISDYIAAYQPERFKEAYRGETEVWSANWKLAVENGIESYHLFKVHENTLEQLTPSRQSFYLAGSAEWALTGGEFVDKRNALTKWLSGDQPKVYQHYVLVFLPPSFIGILDAESFSWISVLPDGASRCLVNSGGVSEYSGELPAEEQQFTQAFLAEDKMIVERVQQGMSSQYTQGGKLLGMEQIVVDFRQFLASRLFGENGDAFREGDKADIFKGD